MCNSFTMSFFMPPISPVRERETGRTTKMPTLTPLRSVDLQEVYQLITTDRRLAQLTLEVRKAADEGDEQTCRILKQQTLPYVTPCGVFSRRRSDCLQQESGLRQRGAGGVLGGVHRRADRIPVVQRLPRPGFHGRYRLADPRDRKSVV